MPHIVIEHSANLSEVADVAGIVRAVHEAALSTGVFPLGGTRTRSASRAVYAIADGDPANIFVAVVARIGAGRPPEVRRNAAEQIFAALTAALAPVFAAHPLAISFEIQEIDPVGSLKQNNLHEIVAARAKTKAEASAASGMGA